MAWPDWDTPLSKQDVSPRELRLAQNEVDALPAGALASTSRGPVASNPPIPWNRWEGFHVEAGANSPQAVGDGIADDTAAVNAAIVAAQAAGGGTVLFSGGKTYKCLSAIAIPFTSPGTNPKQVPLRFTTYGGGPTWDGRWPANPLNGGAVLDLRYNGGDGTHVAKIDSRGAGFLEIDHMVIKSGGSDNYQIMQTTNTTVHIHHNAILGNQANSGTSCVQDFILLGGSSLVVSDASNAPFQGYGSKMHDNFYHNIRRVATWGTYCNGIEAENDTVSSTCGSSEAQAAPYVFAPAAGSAVSGNRIKGGTLELTNYKYAVALLNDVIANTFDSISVYDPGAGILGYIYCGSATTTLNNLIIAGWAIYGNLQTKLLDGPGAGVNTVISANRDAGSQFPRGITSYSGGPVIMPFRGQPGSGQFNFLAGMNYNAANIFEISPSTATDGSTFANKGLRVDQNGKVQSTGQFYPGDEALSSQTTGGLLHSAGVPANGNGVNNDWCISDNGHLYFKAAGSWSQKI